MDALSEALSTVRMSAAIFFNAEYTAPWGFEAPRAAEIASALAPGVEHIVIFHLVSEGRALARMDGVPDLTLEAGDILIVPHGDTYTVTNGSPDRLRNGAASVARFVAGDYSTVRHGGGGEQTNFVCGYFGCERQALRLFLAGLPRMIRINVRGDEAGEWLEASVRHLVLETASAGAGSMVLLSKMAEALFVEALRRYMAYLPAEQTGWLAGARDAVVGGALAVLHRNPCLPWTVPKLAAEVGTSRTVLTERFAHFLGESPINYLSRWRLQLAARLLEGGRKTMLQVAMDVGYESEAAFSRAFKREFGLPPAQYRKRQAGRVANESIGSTDGGASAHLSVGVPGSASA